MLSARAYSFHQKSKLAISLSWIGGYTNVITLLVCGWTISHVTGTTTWFAKTLIERSVAPGNPIFTAAYFGYVLLTFWLGAVLSAFLLEGAERSGHASKYVLPMAAEAILLSIFAIRIDFASRHEIHSLGWHLYFTSGVASTAMGLQNATITRISGAVVRTTHLTGVITDLGLESVQFFNWYRDQARGRSWKRKRRLLRVSQRHPTVLRLLLLASIFGSFLFGVVAGTFAFHHAPTFSMLLPIGFLCFIIFMDWWKPIANVRELDLLSDPELKLYGILHELLPPTLGIYRLAAHQHRGVNRAPNFQVWAEHLPQRWKVVILALTPTMRLDENAVLDLEFALQRVNGEHRKLIICGIGVNQYKALDDLGLSDKIGAENLCPDLEFAIARGIELVREVEGLRSTRDVQRLA